MRTSLLALSLSGLMATGPSYSQTTQTPDALHAMFQGNQVFALRDAVQHGHAPLFYRGAVEASLNQIRRAQRDLGKVIQAAPHSTEAFDARDVLGNAYFRNGMYHEALAEAESEHAERPDAADVNNVLPLFRALGAAGDTHVARLKPTRLMRAGDDHGMLPVKINGQDVTYGFDTGADVSVMGQADAKRLGLIVTRVATTLTESSGSGIPGFDIAIAKDMVIGGLHLQNVAFFVLQDTGDPFKDMPVGTRGLIGLPVLVAMRTVRSEHSGWFEFGGKPQPHGVPLQNMLFHEQNPVVAMTVNNKPVTMTLDTGATDTDLNESFAKAFPELVAAGKKETRPITGLGGSTSYDSVLLGPVTFHLGGRDITLPSPHVFVSHSLGIYDGNLGHDILDQAQAVTIDFRSMALILE